MVIYNEIISFAKQQSAENSNMKRNCIYLKNFYFDRNIREGITQQKNERKYKLRNKLNFIRSWRNE